MSLVTSILSDIRLSDLGVLRLVQPCSNSQISLRGICWLIYLWWGDEYIWFRESVNPSVSNR